MIKGIDYVYCVSDCYLRALVAESRPYSFEVKGCCSLEDGLSQLMTINVSEIKGFVILIQDLGEDDDYFYNLVDLINAINDISEGHTLVLGVCYSDNYKQLEGYIDTDNLNVYLVDDIELVTDVIIRRDIYGTIVRNVCEPYLEKPKTKVNDYEEFKSSNVEPIFRESIQRLKEPVVIAPNLRRAVENDEVLASISKDDSIAYFLRSEQINRAYGVDKDNSSMLDLLLNNVADTSLCHIYKSLYKLIQGGEL